MSREKLGQEPAFASEERFLSGHDQMGNQIFETSINYGMSKRFYAACAAIESGHCMHPTIEDTVEYAYKLADELLKQEDSK